jgi:hypothetical protein
MTDHSEYFEQIQELIQANGWEKLLTAECVPPYVVVKLGEGHSTAPLEIVNHYAEGVNPIEQIQQECLRALRTGRPGI